MRVLWLPRSDRLWQDRVEATRHLGHAVAVVLGTPGQDPEMTESLASALSSGPDVAVLEAATVLQPNGWGSWRMLGTVAVRVPTVLWYEEVRDWYPPILGQVVSNVRLLAVNHADERYVRPWRALGYRGPVALLWGSGDPAWLGPQGTESPPHWDVVFAANFSRGFPAHQERLETLRALAASGLSVAVRGLDWPSIPGVEVLPYTHDARQVGAFLREGKVSLHVPNYAGVKAWVPERVWWSFAAGRGVAALAPVEWPPNIMGAVVSFGAPSGAPQAILPVVRSEAWRQMGQMGMALVAFGGPHSWASRLRWFFDDAVRVALGKGR